MQENTTEHAPVLAALLAKFLPAAVGAGVMIAVDWPKTRRDAFARIFCAFSMSYLFGDVAFDFLQSFNLFSFLDPIKHGHKTAVDGLMGATGWSLASGVAVMMRRFRKKPFDVLGQFAQSGRDK
jgi:hypothetical protein